MNIARSGFSIFITKLVLSLLSLGAGIILARSLGSEGAGKYFLFFAIIGLVVSFCNFGVGGASLYLLNKKKRSFSHLLSNALLFGLGWGAILSIILYVFFAFFSNLAPFLPRSYFLLSFLIIPFHLLINYLLPFFLARFDFLKWSFFSVFYGVLVLFGIIGSVLVLGVGVIGVTGALLAVAGSSVVTFLFLLSVLVHGKRFEFQMEPAVFREQLSFGLRSYLGDLFQTIHFNLNLFMASLFVGIVSVGHFAIALNAASVLFSIPFALQQVLNPLWSSQEETEVDRVTPRIARKALLLGIMGALLLFLVTPHLIPFLFGREFLPAVRPLLFLLPGFICMVFAGVFFNNFFSKGKPYITSFILAGALLLNVVLSVVFIPVMGIIGAAIATSVSYLFAAILALLSFSRITHYPIREIIRLRPSDFHLPRFQIIQPFRSKKFMSLESDVTVEHLKGYYEKQAKENRDILHASFDSPSFVKRVFYASRVHTIMDFLELNPTSRVLEIGCGVGYYTRKIAAVTPYLIATDISQNYVDQAKAANPHPIEAYVACPVEKLPFPDNSFDTVLMSEVIEHLIDSEQGVREIWRVLRPGGKAVIATPNKNSYLNILYHIRINMSGSYFDQDHIREFSRKELQDLLGRYFSLKKFRYVNYFPVYFPPFFVRLIGSERIEKVTQRLELLLNRIPLIQRFGFSQVVQVVRQT